MTFEVHVTGTQELIQQLALAGLKTIAVDLFSPDRQYLRTEHMTSQIMKCDTIEDCYSKVVEILRGYDVERLKIECPVYEQYKSRALYIETHFVSGDFVLPTSRNQRKETFLATDRTSKLEEFDAFGDRYAWKELELCLVDTNVGQDADWLSLYGLQR